MTRLHKRLQRLLQLRQDHHKLLTVITSTLASEPLVQVRSAKLSMPPLTQHYANHSEVILGQFGRIFAFKFECILFLCFNSVLS